MIDCIRSLPAAVALTIWLCIAGSIATALGFRLPQRLPVSACYTLGQVELCSGGATCVPTLEMLCVSRGLAYERHTYVFLEGTYIGQRFTTAQQEVGQLRAVSAQQAHPSATPCVPSRRTCGRQ